MVSMDSLLQCAPELETQLCLIVMNAIFWNLWISLSSKHIFEPWVAAQAWKDRWTALNRKTFKNSFFVEFETEYGAFEFACFFLAILVQHAVGGMLALPSTLGFTGQTVWALACHGALCEAGWELQDLATRFVQIVFGGKEGAAKNPPPLLLIMCIHHAMGLCMVIPMNVYFRDNASYHEFVFLLQFAAFAAMGLSNYGFTLDISAADGLKRMKIAVTITWVVMIYSRFVRYCMVGYYLMQDMRAEGSHPAEMFYVGIFVLGLMSLLNTLFILDATGKFTKFIKMHHESEDIHEAAAAVNGAMQRQNSTALFVLTTSQKEWAKVRGAMRVLGEMKRGKKVRDTKPAPEDKDKAS